MYLNNEQLDISVLKGQIIKSITGEQGDTELRFNTDSGTTYLMYHEQDCCEYVYLEDICGDPRDLINSEILNAYESSNVYENTSESATWTFYNFETIKGSVTLRWLGESNGNYSESVDFIKLND